MRMKVRTAKGQMKLSLWVWGKEGRAADEVREEVAKRERIIGYAQALDERVDCVFSHVRAVDIGEPRD